MALETRAKRPSAAMKSTSEVTTADVVAFPTASDPAPVSSPQRQPVAEMRTPKTTPFASVVARSPAEQNAKAFVRKIRAE